MGWAKTNFQKRLHCGDFDHQWNRPTVSEAVAPDGIHQISNLKPQIPQISVFRFNHPCDWRSFVFEVSRPVRRFQALRNWGQSVSECFALWSRISNSSLKTRPGDSLGATAADPRQNSFAS